jgi:methyl-accepting chemotaxis protein
VKKNKVSLMVSIMLLCVGLVLISSLSIRFFAYKSAKTAIEDTMGQTALTITQAFINKIDVDKFEELQVAEDMENDYYTELRNELNEFKESTGLQYLYTMGVNSEGDYYYVVDGAAMDNEEASLLGDKEESMSDAMITCFHGQEGYELSESELWGTQISGYVPIKKPSGEVIGILGADFDASYMAIKLEEANTNMYIVMGIISLLSILIAILFSYLIINSLKQLQLKIQLMQQGDLTINVSNNRGDEVGSLSRSFQAMLESLSVMIHNIRNHSELVIQDVDALNYNIDISNKSTEEITKIVNEIAVGAMKQVDSVDEMKVTIHQVFNEVETIKENIDSVNNDSDLAIKDMQEVSEKLSGSVKQINLVNDTVETTATMMKKLEDKFQEVLSFSTIITSISARTNLLALNASIEAASAGEHGKGFAVVAGEIKNLAKQSSEASNRINELILAVQSEINNSSDAIESGVVQARDGVDVMSQVQVYLDKLSNSNQKIDIRIKDIAKAIINIEADSRNVLDKTSRLTAISRELNDGTQQTAAETQEQYAMMEEIKNNLLIVKERMEQLGSTVNKFKINA